VNKVGVDPPRAAGIGVEGSVSRLARINVSEDGIYWRGAGKRKADKMYCYVSIDSFHDTGQRKSKWNGRWKSYLLGVSHADTAVKRRPMLRCSDAPMLSV
jgi:hypothetical protein